MRKGVEATNAIWFFAAGYFLCYAPYSGMTKALSSGLYDGTPDGGVAGASLLPIATMVAVVIMVAFISSLGWWKYASQATVFGRQIPVPTRWTALSGLCTSVIIATTTLAYTFDGVSIVFVMLLMRGGVLILAPIVDASTGRRTHWFSWVGLALSMSALLVAFMEKGGYEITLVCAIDIAAYLVAYLIRLRFMSKLAKSDDADTTKRYFVEESLISTPATLVLLGIGALIGEGEFLQQVRAGFTTHFESGLVLETAIIGALSQGTGIFGTLIFLDKRENTFSVPVNRCSSIMAGVVASLLLAAFFDRAIPSAYQLAGAGLVVAAIVVLSLGPKLSRKPAA